MTGITNIGASPGKTRSFVSRSRNIYAMDKTKAPRVTESRSHQDNGGVFTSFSSLCPRAPRVTWVHALSFKTCNPAAYSLASLLNPVHRTIAVVAIPQTASAREAFSPRPAIASSMPANHAGGSKYTHHESSARLRSLPD